MQSFMETFHKEFLKAPKQFVNRKKPCTSRALFFTNITFTKKIECGEYFVCMKSKLQFFEKQSQTAIEICILV